MCHEGYDSYRPFAWRADPLKAVTVGWEAARRRRRSILAALHSMDGPSAPGDEPGPVIEAPQ